ncbi:MAG TPA: hypothetical protein VFV90_03210, partial [Usitatibacter sp.]|nr:hypothetical protein [Usitatibacter sp.]
IGLAAQFVLSSLTGAGARNAVKFSVPAGERAQVVSAPFKLGGFLDGPVTLRTASNVRDTWLNLDLQLTNVDTGRAYGIRRTLGFTKVGALVDGSSDDVGEIGSVPPGRYTLGVAASAGASPTAYPPPTFNGNVEAYRSSLGWSNYWFFVVAILLWPFIAWRREAAFESQRWSESDYAEEGFGGSDDDDDD